MYILLGVAVMFVVFGVMIRCFKCYWLISGYNTMTDAQKEKVNVEGLGRLMGNFCIFMALVLTAAAITALLELATASICIIAVVPIAVIVMLIRAQYYDGNTKNEDGSMKLHVKLIIGFIALLFIALAAFLLYTSRPSEIVVSDQCIDIKGAYGMRIAKDEVVSAALEDSIPKVLYKTNGFDLGTRLKGDFNLEGLGRTKLFVNADSPPFILLETKAGKVIINRPAAEDTRKLYGKLVSQGYINK